MRLPAFVCLSVCLSVCKQDYSKMRAWIWKCCVSTDVGTWTNWLTFEPNLDYSLDVGTGLLSPLSYKPCNAEFYIGLNPTYTYWSLQRRVISQWLHSLRQWAVKTFVGGTCAPPSALLVFLFFRTLSQKTAEPIIAKLEHKMYPMPRVLGKKVKLFQFHVRY